MAFSVIQPNTSSAMVWDGAKTILADPTVSVQPDNQQILVEGGQLSWQPGIKLDGSGLIPLSYLPLASVDNVDSYPTFANFPVTGLPDKIYVSLDDGASYRWTGAQYIEFSNPTTYLKITNAAAQYVPYSGCNHDINLGTHQLVTSGPMSTGSLSATTGTFSDAVSTGALTATSYNGPGNVATTTADLYVTGNASVAGCTVRAALAVTGTTTLNAAAASELQCPLYRSPNAAILLTLTNGRLTVAGDTYATNFNASNQILASDIRSTTALFGSCKLNGSLQTASIHSYDTNQQTLSFSGTTTTTSGDLIVPGVVQASTEIRCATYRTGPGAVNDGSFAIGSGIANFGTAKIIAAQTQVANVYDSAGTNTLGLDGSSLQIYKHITATGSILSVNQAVVGTSVTIGLNCSVAGNVACATLNGKNITGMPVIKTIFTSGFSNGAGISYMSQTIAGKANIDMISMLASWQSLGSPSGSANYVNIQHDPSNPPAGIWGYSSYDINAQAFFCYIYGLPVGVPTGLRITYVDTY